MQYIQNAHFASWPVPAPSRCAAEQSYTIHNPTRISWISVGLAALTLFFILCNFKGVRTLIAAGLTLAGSFFILESELRTGDMTNYYAGSTILLLGVWVNGSFHYFFKKWMRPVWGNNKTERRAFEILVKNNKPQPVNLTVQDQFPIPTDKSISVEDLKYDEAELDKEKQILTWKLELAPRAERMLNLQYAVKYPKGKVLVLE